MKSPPNFFKSFLENRGITQRIVAYILFVSAVPVLLIAMSAFQSGSQGIRNHTEAHLTSVVIVKTQEVERWFRPLEAAARLISDSPSVQSRILTVASEQQQFDLSSQTHLSLIADLASATRRIIGVEEIMIVSADGQSVLVSNGTTQSFDVGILPLSSQSSSALGLYLPPYLPGDEVPDAAIHNAVRVNGEVIAHVVLLVSPMPLYEALTPDAGLGGSGKVYMVNFDGEVLTPPQLAAPAAGVLHVAPEVAQLRATPSSGSRYLDFAGTEVFGAYQPIESLGWGVIAEIPTSVAFRDIDRLGWVILGASMAYIVLLAIAAMLVTRHITRPVRVLADGARTIGGGDLNHRIRITSGDELGQLAETFNQMAQDLAATQSRVVEAEREAALQGFREQKIKQLDQLSRFGLSLANEFTLEGIAIKTPFIASEITRAAVAGLAIFREGETVVEHCCQSNPAYHAVLLDFVSNRTVLDALRAGKTVASHPATPEQTEVRFETSLFKSLLIVPVRAEFTNVLGAIIVARKADGDPFNREEYDLVQIVAGYVGATVQRIRKERSLQVSEQTALNAVKDLKTAQTQLVQAQKMESVGRLAGGVAHDFNNLLTPILAYAQLAGRNVEPENNKLRSQLQEIESAAERAANLTRQLLAFSRREVIEPRVININSMILDMHKMLKRLIGEDIDLVTLTAEDLKHTRIDPGQIEQILMNLVVNARDAMPSGGKVTIETANVFIDRQSAILHPPLQPGEFIVLAVSDTGFGMSEEVKSHIFEPFFTTKEEGKGTGLGLATCYGIADQNGGYIAVYSEEGNGTTFKVYLPAIEGDDAASGQPEPQVVVRGGSETVLLVEDEDAVRRIASQILSAQGYQVIEASDGVEAITASDAHRGPIHLLFTDVVMPVMGGRELADKLRRTRPETAVMYTSGYTDDAIVRHGVLNQGVAFIQKPFSAVTLAVRVRELLDHKFGES